MEQKNITVVTGTARRDNMSQHVARVVAQAFIEKDLKVTEVAVKDHITTAVTLPPWGAGGADEVSTPWKEIVVQTDTFVFVLPEYNHSYPGEWKLLMDSLYGEYAGKTAYVVAVGGGQFAGARVMEHVMPVLINFKFVVPSARLHIPHASKTVSTNGELVDADVVQRLASFVTDVCTDGVVT